MRSRKPSLERMDRLTFLNQQQHVRNNLQSYMLHQMMQPSFRKRSAAAPTGEPSTPQRGHMPCFSLKSARMLAR